MYWYDGQLIEDDKICLSITDPGFIYGATVFTTLRVYHQSLDHPLTQWQAHCHRLETNLQVFSWPSPNWQQIYQGAVKLLKHYPVLRITLFPDGREWISGRFLPEDLPERQRKGIKGWVANDSLFERTLPSYKTGNYLGAWLALQQAKTLGCQEAILVDSQGNWLESSTGNLWGWKDGVWYTPPLAARILPGIGRSQLITWLQHQHLEVMQHPWTADWVPDLTIIAYTNSAVEVIPFAEIVVDETTLSFEVAHPALKQLSDYYKLG